MMDLMYFGYDHENDSAKFEKEFKGSIVKVFPDVKLVNAYDDIKGYRQEVHLPDEQKDNYLSWLIGDGWLEMSFTMQIMMMDKEQKEEFKRIFALAKKQYPQAFKPEAVQS
jgi:hypothetical protein